MLRWIPEKIEAKARKTSFLIKCQQISRFCGVVTNYSAVILGPIYCVHIFWA